jgi:thioesterase domain-containing protein
MNANTPNRLGPLFLICETPAANGPSAALSAHDVPVYELSAVAPRGSQPRTIEARAFELATEIRNRCAGPYALVGWHLGGVLAFAIASSLLSQDEDVAFLGVVGSAGLARNASGGGSPPLTVDDAVDLRSFARRVCDYRAAVASYEPEPIGIPLHVILERSRSEPSDRNVAEPFYDGWDTYIPASEIRRVPIAGPYSSIDALTTIAHERRAPAAARRPASPRGARRLIEIQSGSNRVTPVVCIPGAGDNAMAFFDFANALGAHVPVKAFQPRGLSYPELPHGTVESAAKTYVDELLAELDGEDVHLVGHSFGGWVAFEMARTVAPAQRPRSLTLIDTEPPNALRTDFPTPCVFAEWARVLELSTGVDIGWDAASMREATYEETLRFVHQKLVQAGQMPVKSRWNILRGPLRTFAAAIRTGYTPAASVDFAVNLVFADDPEQSTSANAARHDAELELWRRWAPRASAWHGPGNHITVLRSPHVDDVVTWWRSGRRADVDPGRPA